MDIPLYSCVGIFFFFPVKFELDGSSPYLSSLDVQLMLVFGQAVLFGCEALPLEHWATCNKSLSLRIRGAAQACVLKLWLMTP